MTAVVYLKGRTHITAKFLCREAENLVFVPEQRR